MLLILGTNISVRLLSRDRRILNPFSVPCPKSIQPPP